MADRCVSVFRLSTHMLSVLSVGMFPNIGR